MEENSFLKILDEKLSKDNWQYIDYYVLLSYLRSGEQIVIVDVSAEDNLRYFNHKQITYINIPYKEIISKIAQVEPYKSHTIVCVCAGGPKSAVAALLLGFKNINAIYLSGGVEAVAQINKVV
jgi:rhodanese-related sulfurtransferase